MSAMQATSSFDYAALLPDMAAEARAVAARWNAPRRPAPAAIGSDLLAIKRQIGHGKFCPWLADAGINERAAQRAMREAEKTDNTMSVLPNPSRVAIGRKTDKTDAPKLPAPAPVTPRISTNLFGKQLAEPPVSNRRAMLLRPIDLGRLRPTADAVNQVINNLRDAARHQRAIGGRDTAEIYQEIADQMAWSAAGGRP